MLNDIWVQPVLVETGEGSHYAYGYDVPRNVWLYSVKNVWPIIPFIILLNPFGVMRGLVPIPAAIGRDAGTSRTACQSITETSKTNNHSQSLL